MDCANSDRPREAHLWRPVVQSSVEAQPVFRAIATITQEVTLSKTNKMLVKDGRTEGR